MQKCSRCEIMNGDSLENCFICGYSLAEVKKPKVTVNRFHPENVNKNKAITYTVYNNNQSKEASASAAAFKNNNINTNVQNTAAFNNNNINTNVQIQQPVTAVNDKKGGRKISRIIAPIVSSAAAVLIIVSSLIYFNHKDDDLSGSISYNDKTTASAEAGTKTTTATKTTSATKKSTETKPVTTAKTESANHISAGGTLGEGGDALTILCWTEDDLKFMYDIVADYSGMDKSMMVYKQVGSAGGEANEKYTQVFASGADADLYFCDADWNQAYQNNDNYSAPLSAVGITEDMYENAFEYTIGMGKDDSGVLKGATWQCCPGGYVYRADLAEQYLGVTSPVEMQAAVDSWDDFWAAAAKVYKASGGKTAMADSLGGVWRAYSNGNRTTPWVQNGRITVDNAYRSIGDFISMAKTNYDAGYISSASQWTADWLPQGMSSGSQANKTMGFFFPTWSLGAGSQLYQAEGEKGEAGSTYGMWNVCPGPTGWFWGGSWICVSPKCDNATEAGQFIYYMTVDSDSMKAYVDAKGDFVNNMVVMADVIESGTNSNPLLGGQDQLDALAASAAIIDMSIATKYDAVINNDLQYAVQDYCEGNIKSEDECFEEFMNSLAGHLTGVTVE